MADLPSANPLIHDVLSEGNLDFFNDILQDLVKPQPARIKSSFNIPASKQERGKPYFIHEQFRSVTTKSGNRFPVHLTGIEAGDTIRISIFYGHEDYMEEPVRCDVHPRPFEVEPRSLGLQPPYQVFDSNPGGYSVSMTYTEWHGGEVKFRFKPNCLNSCKKTCSERYLKFEHLSSDGTILETSEWELRVCSIPKRDFELMIASRDPNTGEKRKSLYSKACGKKKIKVEFEGPASTSAEHENYDAQSLVAASREMEDVNQAVNWVTGQEGQPSTSKQASMPEEIILVCDEDSSPPLFQEKALVRSGEISANLPSRLARPNPIYVQMNSVEDEELVRKLIHRLNGTVHELTRKT